MPALTGLLSRKLAALGGGLIVIATVPLEFRAQCLVAGLSVVAMLCQAFSDRYKEEDK
jgi:hypothetical protein